MKKKYLWGVFVLVFSIVIVSGVAVASSVESNKYYQWGSLLKGQKTESLMAKDSSPTMIKANSFSLTENDVVNSAAEWELNGDYSAEEAEKIASERLIAKYAVYNYAKENGFAVTDEYVESVIQSMKDSVKNAENYSDFEMFLKGINMTCDQYFNSQYDNLYIYETIANFKKSCYDDFTKEYDSSEYTQEEYEKLFDNYYSDIVSRIIDSEEIIYAK